MTQSPSGWEHFEVEADVGVHAWGPTLRDAFAQAALGVFALVVVPDSVMARETREARAQGASRETLLVNWINECLYVHEIEGFAVRDVEITRLDMVVRSRDGDKLPQARSRQGEPVMVVHGLLHGEALDAGRHQLRTVVKAATLHNVEVIDGPDRVDVRIVVDV